MEWNHMMEGMSRGELEIKREPETICGCGMEASFLLGLNLKTERRWEQMALCTSVYFHNNIRQSQYNLRLFHFQIQSFARVVSWQPPHTNIDNIKYILNWRAFPAHYDCLCSVMMLETTWGSAMCLIHRCMYVRSLAIRKGCYYVDVESHVGGDNKRKVKLNLLHLILSFVCYFFSLLFLVPLLCWQHCLVSQSIRPTCLPLSHLEFNTEETEPKRMELNGIGVHERVSLTNLPPTG